MKKATILIALFVTVIIILVFIRQAKVPFGKKNSSFAIEWVDDAAMISITEGVTQLNLRKVDGQWEVNEKFAARPSAISFLLTTLDKLQIKSPLSDELFAKIVSDENTRIIKVKVSGSGKRSSGFNIYVNPELSSSTVMTRDGSSKPFILYLPGYQSDPGMHFVADESFWMPNRLFNLHPETIRSINIDYRDEALDDIYIDLSDEHIALRINDTEINEFNVLHVRRFVSYFSYVPFEAWVTDIDDELRAGLLESVPEIEFRVELLNEEEIIVKLWIRYTETAEGFIPDTDRLFGALDNSGEIFVVKYFDLDPLIKTSDYFIMD